MSNRANPAVWTPDLAPDRALRIEPPETTVVDPAALCDAESDALVDELYAAHCLIFDGVDRETFARYVVRSTAERTRIQIFRAHGQVVGYAAIHMFARTIDGRPTTVVRCEVGLLPAYRRQTRFGWFFLREVLALMLRAPGRAVLGLSCAVNPATYRTLASKAEVWPHWSRPTPAALSRLMDELADDFGMTPVDPAVPGVFHVGWQPRETDDEIRSWHASDHPASRFYLRRNPGYGRGHGLLLLVPMSPGRLIRSATRLAVQRLRKSGRLALGAATRHARASSSAITASIDAPSTSTMKSACASVSESGGANSM